MLHHFWASVHTIISCYIYIYVCVCVCVCVLKEFVVFIKNLCFDIYKQTVESAFTGLAMAQ